MTIAEYRTENEQIDGLRRLQQAVWQSHHVKLSIVLGIGDVAALRVSPSMEVVYAVGGFDLWNKGEPETFNLTEHDAYAAIAAIFEGDN